MAFSSVSGVTSVQTPRLLEPQLVHRRRRGRGAQRSQSHSRAAAQSQAPGTFPRHPLPSKTAPVTSGAAVSSPAPVPAGRPEFPSQHCLEAFRWMGLTDGGAAGT